MNYIYINNNDKINLILKNIIDLNFNNVVGFDTETSGLDHKLDKLRLAQFEINDSIYILNIEEMGTRYLKYILELLIEKKTIFIVVNGKFDIKFILENTGVIIPQVFDLMVAESVITGSRKLYASLAYLLDKYLDVQMDKSIRDDFRSKIITNEMLLYSALDVKYLKAVMNLQLKKINELQLNKVSELEMRIVPATAKMEFDGIYLDKDKWTELLMKSRGEVVLNTKKIKDDIWTRVKFEYANAYEFVTKFEIRISTKKLKAELESIADKEHIKTWWYENFNVNSRLNMISAFKMLGIDLPNFQMKTLERFKDKDRIVKYTIDLKLWAKKDSTYGLSFLKNIHSLTGKVHSEFNQNGTETGRYSSAKPNLQNIPILVIDGKCLWRECFLPSKEHVMLASDYSQQEYRIVGQITEEDKIINAYINNIDLHTNTACIIYSITPDEVTEEQRFVGKTVNFGLLYGLTAFGLARNLNIKMVDASLIMKKVLSGLPKFVIFKKKVEEFVTKNHFSRTMLGRLRFFDDEIVFKDHKEYDKHIGKLKREGFNHIIQGTAADMLKLAFAYVFEENPFGEKFKVILLIHDEIVAEVHKDVADAAKIFLEGCMEKAFSYFVTVVPININAKIINAWGK